MSPSEKSAWSSFAASHPVTDAIAGQRLNTGQNWFFRHARQLFAWGVPTSVWAPVRSAGFNHPWVQAWLDDITTGGWTATYADTQVLNRLLYKLAGIGALDAYTIIYPMAGNAGEPFRWPVYNRGSALTPGTLYNMGSSAYYPRGVSRGVYFDGQTSRMAIPNYFSDPGFPYAIHVIGTLSYVVTTKRALFGASQTASTVYFQVSANSAAGLCQVGGAVSFVCPDPRFTTAITMAAYSNVLRVVYYDYSEVTRNTASYTPSSPTIYPDLGCQNTNGSHLSFLPYRMKSFAMFHAPTEARVAQVAALLKECDDGLTGPLE